MELAAGGVGGDIAPGDRGGESEGPGRGGGPRRETGQHLRVDLDGGEEQVQTKVWRKREGLVGGEVR